MPIGFETYIAGTTRLQLTDKTKYFMFVEKVTPTLPAENSPAWRRESVSSTQQYAYYETFLDLPVSVGLNEKLVIAVQALTYPASFYFSIVGRGLTTVRIQLCTYSKTSQYSFYVFSNRAPPPNNSRQGLELYRDGSLVFASETRVLRPLVMIKNNAEATQFGTRNFGFSVGVACMCQWRLFEQDYEYESKRYSAIEALGSGNFSYGEFTADTSSSGGSEYSISEAGSTIFMYIDLRGYP